MKEIFDKTLQRLSALDKRIAALETRAQNPRMIGARVVRSSTQSIPNNTDTDILFSSASYDTDTFWVVGTPTRLTVPYDGYYTLDAFVEFAVNSSNTRILRAYLNGSTILSGLTIPAHPASFTRLSISATVFMSATNYVVFRVLQDTGASLNLQSAICSITRIA